MGFLQNISPNKFTDAGLEFAAVPRGPLFSNPNSYCIMRGLDSCLTEGLKRVQVVVGEIFAYISALFHIVLFPFIVSREVCRGVKHLLFNGPATDFKGIRKGLIKSIKFVVAGPFVLIATFLVPSLLQHPNVYKGDPTIVDPREMEEFVHAVDASIVVVPDTSSIGESSDVDATRGGSDGSMPIGGGGTMPAGGLDDAAPSLEESDSWVVLKASHVLEQGIYAEMQPEQVEKFRQEIVEPCGNSISEDTIKQMIQDGRAILHAYQEHKRIQINTQGHARYPIYAVMWYLVHRGYVHGNNDFIEGMRSIPVQEEKAFYWFYKDHMEKAGYQRESSHWKGLVNKQFGIDRNFKDSLPFPANRGTILFAEAKAATFWHQMSIKDNTLEEWFGTEGVVQLRNYHAIILKFEPFGCNMNYTQEAFLNSWQVIGHAMTGIRAVLQRWEITSQPTGARREHIASEHLDKFFGLVQHANLLNKEDWEKFKKIIRTFGYMAMIPCMKNLLKRNQEKLVQDTQEPVATVIAKIAGTIWSQCAASKR